MSGGSFRGVSDRPDYVHCVKKPDGKAVWCGRDRGREFFFTDVEHALMNGEQGGRLLMCRDCEEAICVSLRTASSGEKPVDVERMDELGARWTHPNQYGAGAPLSADELKELQGLRRRYEARYREPSTLPQEVRASIDRILAAKRAREAESAVLQAGQREIDRLEADLAETKTLRSVLERISEQLQEHGEHYDGQLGISTRGFELLEAAWNERGGPT